MHHNEIVYTDFHALERDLGISLKTLYTLSNQRSKHYKKVFIPKKNGGTRTLAVPDALLKKVQRRILSVLLAYMPSSPFATAYEYGRSICKNALPHVGRKYLLKVDIEDFFGSITYGMVKEKVFDSAHFSEPIRILLSLLCYYKDCLPQGAPTSPKIANLVLRDFDYRIGTWCTKRGISYTRYCDDLTLSGDIDLRETHTFVTQELWKEHFRLHKDKTRFIHADRQQQVTGIVVNYQPRVSTEYCKKIRQEMYYCQKFGIESHLKKIGYTAGVNTYYNHLLGKINYVLSIMPDNKEMLAYKQTLQKFA